MKAVLDTNFIITCVKQKIDFKEDIENMGTEIIIPEEVIYELRNISGMKGKKGKDKEAVKLALDLIERQGFKKIRLNNRDVDRGLIKLAKADPEIIIATLDRRVKDKTGRAMVISDKKQINII